MSVILMTTMFNKALILQGEIWCWSLLGLKGLKNHYNKTSSNKKLTASSLIRIAICVLFLETASTTEPFVFSTSWAPCPDTCQYTVEGPSRPPVLCTVKCTVLPLASLTVRLRESGAKLITPNASSLGRIVTWAVFATAFSWAKFER